MVIIFEGIDRVGKTTLANKAKEIINADMFKAERIEGEYCTPNENSAVSFGYCMGQIQLFNNTYAQSLDKHIIIDRFHWTEYVYTKVQRNRSLSDYYLKHIEAEMFKQRNGYLIICMQPIDLDVCNRMHGSDLREHQSLFDKVYKESILPFKYKYTYMTTDIALGTIDEFVKGNLKERV